MADSSAPYRAPERPDVFGYHDYRSLLGDWLKFLKETRPGFSSRRLAIQSQLSPSFVTMVLSGERKLTLKALTKILPWLELERSEQNHLRNLVMRSLGSAEAELAAISKMTRSTPYQKRNPGESEFFVYMSHWYYIAIREMADLPDFQFDPLWIQGRLKSKVHLANIKTALEFLVRHGYLKISKDGAVCPPKGSVDCRGAVYWPALTEYHKQMFALATESIRGTNSGERNLDGYTVALDSARFEAARKIMDRAMEEIASLGQAKEQPAERIYHLEFALFPLTKAREEK